MQLTYYTEKYYLTTDVIWNKDEKGFVIDQAFITQRNTSYKAL